MANKFARIIVAVLALCALPPTATATMELYFSDFTGDPYQVEILPGESFQIQVGYATTEVSNGLSYWLDISDAGSGEFSITDREFPADCRFLGLITGNTQALAVDAALLDPRNDRDLGASNANPTVAEPPGLYVVATITITTASDVASGTYTLNGWECVGTNPAFESIPVSVHDYTIVVTDGSGGGDTDVDPTDTDGGADDSTNGSTTDSGTGDQTTDGTASATDTDSDDRQTGNGETEFAPIAVGSRCGVGIDATTAMAALFAMCLTGTPRGRG